MRTVYLPELVSIEPAHYRLPSEEARHVVQVLRMRVGDGLRVINGYGLAALAEITAISKRQVDIATVGAAEVLPEAPQLTVAVSPPKGNRLETMVRSLTELGVGQLIPLVTERGVRQPKLDRLERVVIEATKQCGRGYFMKITQPQAIDELASASTARDCQLITLDPQGEHVASLRSGLRPGQSDERQAECILVIGPEGGLTEQECAVLADHGSRAVRLAGPILRIETAAVAAAAVWMSLTTSTPSA